MTLIINPYRLEEWLEKENSLKTQAGEDRIRGALAILEDFGLIGHEEYLKYFFKYINQGVEE